MSQKETFWVKLLQAVAVTLLLGIMYLNVDMRDFMKYVQPAIDKQQNEWIKQTEKSIATTDSITSYKVKNLNMRDDATSSDVNEIKQDLKEIKQILTAKYKGGYITNK